jgi:hypothetical protein
MQAESLSAATWFWLLVPMCLAVVLSIVTFFLERQQLARHPGEGREEP